MGDSLRMQAMLLGTLFLGVLGVGLLLMSFYRETSRTTTFVIPADVTDCDNDGDCGVVEQIGCCPCDAGGGQGAINKHMRARLKAFLRRACGHKATCVNVRTCRPDLQPVCAGGGCALTASGGAAPPARDPAQPR